MPNKPEIVGPDHLRLTSFSESEISAEVVFRAIGVKDPETIESRPQIGYSTCAGDFERGILHVTCTPGRVDCVYKVRDPDPDTFKFPHVIGDMNGTLNDLAPLIAQLATLNSSRLAFGAQVYFEPVESHELAYIKLDVLLPSVTLDQNSRDFNYRINRPRVSRVNNGVRINRLSTWSAARFFVATVERHDLTLPVPAFAPKVELDINTLPVDGLKFALEQSTQTMQELAALGMEICERGDVP